jgi:hypothetical protein
MAKFSPQATAILHLSGLPASAMRMRPSGLKDKDIAAICERINAVKRREHLSTPQFLSMSRAEFKAFAARARCSCAELRLSQLLVEHILLLRRTAKVSYQIVRARARANA